MPTGGDIRLFYKQAQGVQGLTSANTWDGVTDAVADRYKSEYTYDANGNIETVARFDETGTQYDNLQYHYEKNGTDLLRNRLYHLNESINGGYGDIGVDASTFHGAHGDVNLLNNYKYDELGNLIADKREEIANIEWAVSGKVKRITRTAGSTKPPLEFAYGADGQRISKTVGDPLNGGYREYYLRDAQGNVMAMYKYADNGASLKVTERPVYGSSRLGSYTRQMELVGEPAIQQWPYTQPMQAPLKRYELTDHLGNVNTVVTGRLLPLLGPGTQYQAEVVSATGYESFGFALPNRSFQSSNYGWGYNGKFKDDEVNGIPGSSLDYGARMRDPRVGPWWGLDPLAAKFPGWSPYNFTKNNPIIYIDPDGRIVKYANEETQKVIEKAIANDPSFAKSMIRLVNSDVTYNFTMDGIFDYMKGAKDGGLTANLGATTSDGNELFVNFSLLKNSAVHGELSALYHETEHALQFDYGESGSKKVGDQWVPDEAYDITDETKALDAGLNAPGTDPVFKKRSMEKSQEQKERKALRVYPKVLKESKEIRNNAGLPTEINHQSSESGKAETKRSENRFYRTHEKRQ